MDLRHLELEQALDQTRMGAGNDDLHAARAAANLDEVNLDVLTLDERLAADLLRSRKDGLALLAAGNNVQISAAAARVDAGDRSVQDLVLLALELGDDHATLRLADALNDDLLCGLGSDAAERLGRDVDVDDVADLRIYLVVSSLLEGDLLVGLIKVLGADDRLAHVHADGLFLAVRLDVNVVSHAVVIALVSGDECLTYAIEHVVHRDALLFFELFQGVKKFCVHHFFQSNSFLYLDRETNRGNVLRLKYDALPADVERYRAVVVACERALDLLCAVQRLVQTDLDRLSHEGLEMLGALETAGKSRRGNAQRVGRHIVKFLCVQHGVKRAGDLLTLVDIHALRVVHGDGQHILSALFFKFYIPQRNAGLFAQGSDQLFHAGDDLLCLQSRPSFGYRKILHKQNVRSGTWPLPTVTFILTLIVYHVSRAIASFFKRKAWISAVKMHKIGHAGGENVSA